MRRSHAAFLSVVLFALKTTVHADPIITTVAGGGPDNVPAVSANVGTPGAIAVDAAGNLFIPAEAQNRVFKVDTAGQLTVVAGTGAFGFSGDGGLTPNATLAVPYGAAVDSAGNLYIADPVSQCIRKVTAATGIITTVVGRCDGGSGYSGDGGPATLARLLTPRSLAVDSVGNLFITDQGNQRVRRVDAVTGIITTVAGTGTAGFNGDRGLATAASLQSPAGVAVDGNGNLFIGDLGNQRVRRVDAVTGLISTVVGTGVQGFNGDGIAAVNAQLSNPFGVAVDSAGMLFIAEQGNNRIRKVDAVTGIISTVAGSGASGFSGDGGPATLARFVNLLWVAVDGTGNLFLSDVTNNRVRRVDATTGIITTVAGNGFVGFSGDNGPATQASLFSPTGIAADSAGNLFIADQGSVHHVGEPGNQRIRKVDAATGLMTTVAGGGAVGFSGDNGPALVARLNFPSGVAVDSVGNIYIADQGNQRIRKVDPNGIITTVAGNGATGFSGDGGPATLASLSQPQAVTVDRFGNLFIADVANQRIRRVDPNGIIITVAGNGVAGFSGDGGPATLASVNLFVVSPTNIAPPEAGNIIAIDQDGNLFIADTNNNRVRKVDAVSGIITTVAGTGAYGFSGDGSSATQASLAAPIGVAVDGAGNLSIVNNGARLYQFFGDFQALENIRRVDANGIITTVAGTGFVGFSGDGGPATQARLNFPIGVTVDSAGTLFIADWRNQRIRRVEFNQQPVAHAGSDQTVDEGILVTLDGSGSHDPNGDSLTYHWTQLAGPAVTLNLSDPLHSTFTAPNVPRDGRTLTFQLTVSDGQLTSNPDTVDVTVKDVNHAPVADAGADQSVQEGSLVTLDGDVGSYDPDGDPVTYSWTQTGGPAVSLSGATTAIPSFPAPQVGPAGAMLTFTLTVDDDVATGNDKVSVQVTNDNHPPVADAGLDQTWNEGVVVTLNGTGSHDPDNDPLTYQWIQVSGPPVVLSSSAIAAPTFTAPQVGHGGATLVFQLVVIDDSGAASAGAQVAIAILDVDDPPRCDLAQASPALLWPPNHKFLTVGITGITDPNNDQVTITITGVTQDELVKGLGDGDTSPDAVLQGDKVLLRAERDGRDNGRVYWVTFTTDDGYGGRCTGSVTICVPHDRQNDLCGNNGQQYNSLQP